MVTRTNRAALRDLVKSVTELASTQVKVGITSEKNKAVGANFNLAGKAAVHEFGSPSQGIPERSYLRATMTEKSQEIADNMINRIYSYIEAGRIIDDNYFRIIGNDVSNLVKQKIVSGNFTPLKASTIKRKGSSKPLIDTDELRGSISYEI